MYNILINNDNNFLRRGGVLITQTLINQLFKHTNWVT